MTELNQAIDITAGITVGSKFYFKTFLASMGLFCYDILQQKLQIIEEPRELNEAWVKYSYYGAMKADKYILFIPYFGKYFVFFDTENDNVIYFERERNSVYFTAIEYKEKVFVFSEKIADIIVFELGDFSHFYPFEGRSFDINLMDNLNIARKESKVVLPTQKEDCIVEIDLDLYSVEFKNLEKHGMIYNIVISYEGGYILTGDRPLILLWDGMNNYRDINIGNEWIRYEKNSWRPLFTNAVIDNSKIYFGAWSYKKFISLDLRNMRIDYLYEMSNKEISYLSKMDDELLLSIVEEDNPKRNCIYTAQAGVVGFNKLKMSDSFRFSGAKREYSRSALTFFIDDVVKQ